MPIRPEHRHFYPIDWPQLSAAIRFGRAEGRCEAGLLVGVDHDGIHPLHERLDELARPGVALVRQHVVGDEDRARPVPGCRAAAGASGAQQGQVGGDHGGDDVHDDDDVDVTQAATGAQPGVRARPGEHAQGARERLDVGGSAGHGLLAGIERARVEVAPRHEGDLVAGLAQLVREGRRVGRHPTLEGVRGADERDGERGAARRRVALRHRLAISPRGRRAGPGWRS